MSGCRHRVAKWLGGLWRRCTAVQRYSKMSYHIDFICKVEAAGSEPVEGNGEMESERMRKRHHDGWLI